MLTYSLAVILCAIPVALMLVGLFDTCRDENCPCRLRLYCPCHDLLDCPTSAPLAAITTGPAPSLPVVDDGEIVLEELQPALTDGGPAVLVGRIVRHPNPGN